MCRSWRELSILIPTSIYLQNVASIQPRTSLVKFARSPCTDPPGSTALGLQADLLDVAVAVITALYKIQGSIAQSREEIQKATFNTHEKNDFESKVGTSPRGKLGAGYRNTLHEVHGLLLCGVFRFSVLITNDSNFLQEIVEFRLNVLQ